jgi:6-pyruvoyltetrahydropterin/6-carboxytetrahydropterin synthase
VFGKCNNPHYHGHNYELIVKVVGLPNKETGYVMDTKKLSEIIQLHVIEKFDHRNFNLDCIEFKTMNPTVENIAIVIYDILRKYINSEIDLQVRLYETEKNFVDYPVI